MDESIRNRSYIFEQELSSAEETIERCDLWPQVYYTPVQTPATWLHFTRGELCQAPSHKIIFPQLKVNTYANLG